jgi:predicted transcriptional regulator
LQLSIALLCKTVTHAKGKFSQRQIIGHKKIGRTFIAGGRMRAKLFYMRHEPGLETVADAGLHKK